MRMWTLTVRTDKRKSKDEETPIKWNVFVKLKFRYGNVKIMCNPYPNVRKINKETEIFHLLNFGLFSSSFFFVRLSFEMQYCMHSRSKWLYNYFFFIVAFYTQKKMHLESENQCAMGNKYFVSIYAVHFLSLLCSALDWLIVILCAHCHFQHFHSFPLWNRMMWTISENGYCHSWKISMQLRKGEQQRCFKAS